jgi:ribonuclease G
MGQDMKGRVVLLDRWKGREAAALVVDGRLDDLLIDPPEDDSPRPGAIARAIAGRPMKGQGGMIVSLWGGQTGFLRQAQGIAPGQKLLVQIQTHAEAGKAAPVATRLLFKGRAAILTPGARGLNIARSIKEPEVRAALEDLVATAMEGAADDLGLIVRSSAAVLDDDAIASEIAELRALADAILAEAGGKDAALLLDAPTAHHLAWRDWVDPAPDQVEDAEGCFARFGLDDQIAALKGPRVALPGGATMYVEDTRALVAIDVNTGSDFSPAAGLKANLAALADLPRQLRLRGLGGQITVDLAPMPRKDRKTAETVLARALKADPVETAVAGWTPLGHLELQRKRDRLPLTRLI